MKKTIITLAITTSILLAGCSGGNDEVVVSMKSGDLTQEAFYNEIKQLAGSELLEQVVMNQILTSKYDVSSEELANALATYEEMYGDEFESVLEQNGYTLAAFKQSLNYQLLQQKALEDQEVTTKEIEAYYNNGQYELNLNRIVLYSTEEAEQVLLALEEGLAFKEAAKEYSVDTDTAETGGELGFLSITAMDPLIVDSVYQLEEKGYSDVIETANGYEIYQLVEKRKVEDYASLEDQKESIQDTIRSIKASTTAWETIEAKLLKEENVQIKDKDLSNAFRDILSDEE